eukprot:gene3296-5737_t
MNTEEQPLLDEVVIFKIIEKIIPEMSDDLEQLSFFSSEIHQNLEISLTSKDHLNGIIGEHLVNNGFSESLDKSLDLCEDILEMLNNPSEEDVKELEEELEDGNCVLCGRDMALTFHHLIPRMTHKKMLKKGFNKTDLNRGIMICRPCHNAIHRLIDHESMALEYYTLDLIMTNEKVLKWIKYAEKQKSVKHAMRKYKK